MKEWKLARTRQCDNCPWLKGSSTQSIPNYSESQHHNLRDTIATDTRIETGDLRVMSCHKSQEPNNAHCIGWLHNQLGVGNNIGLRLMAMRCQNINEIALAGDQVDLFDDTFK